jgi:hypothetical protein
MKKYPILLLLPLVFIYACQSENQSIDVYSYQIQTKTEKIELRKKYLKKESGLIDAEYHIWFQDNSVGLPAPSDYKFIFALEIESDSIDSWIENLEKSPKEISTVYWNELKLDSTKWNLESEPEFYHSKSNEEVKLVFREENIILAYYSTMPLFYSKKID